MILLREYDMTVSEIFLKSQ